MPFFCWSRYGAPCVKLRNIKFCIIFLVKLRAISYIVAIYLYCCNLCKLLQFIYIAKKTLNRLLIAMVIC